jgi:hypothetical protein
MNSLNTIIANALEKSKLGEAGFDEHDIFSPPSMEEKIYFDDTIPPIYDDCNDDYDIFSPPTIEEKINYDYNMPPIFDDYGDEIIMIAILLNLLPLRLIRMTMFMWRVLIILCIWLMIRMFYVIVILLILFMMLLKVIMREGNMVLCISIILSRLSLC